MKAQEILALQVCRWVWAHVRAFGNIFKGDDKKQMDGLVKLMRHIERAGQYKENPPTGKRGWYRGWWQVQLLLIQSQLLRLAVYRYLLAQCLLLAQVKTYCSQQINYLKRSKQPLITYWWTRPKYRQANGAKTGQEVSNSVAGTKVSDDNSKALTSFWLLMLYLCGYTELYTSEVTPWAYLH